MFDISKIKAVLWDLDDTLYSRVEAARLTFFGMFREHLYIDRPESFIEEAVNYMMTQVKRNSMIHEDAFNALLEKYPPDKPYIRDNCVDYYFNHISEFAKPYSVQMDIVKRLRAMGVKTAIVTNIPNGRAQSQRDKISALGIAECFDVILVSAELGIHKPDRRIYDYAAELLGVKNSECLFVGDDPHSDVQGAINADMDVVFLDNFGDGEGLFDSPLVHRVRRIEEFFGNIYG